MTFCDEPIAQNNAVRLLRLQWRAFSMLHNEWVTTIIHCLSRTVKWELVRALFQKRTDFYCLE